jgi:hypothetical protein
LCDPTRNGSILHVLQILEKSHPEQGEKLQMSVIKIYEYSLFAPTKCDFCAAVYTVVISHLLTPGTGGLEGALLCRLLLAKLETYGDTHPLMRFALSMMGNKK